MKNWFIGAGIVLFAFALLGNGALRAAGVDSRQAHKGDAWLGLYLADVEETSNWDDAEGAVVREVVKGGPADKAGLREGDVIIKLRDRTVRDADDVTRDIRKMAPGDEVALLVLRNGRKLNLKVKLEEREKPMGIRPPQRDQQREHPRELQPLRNFFMRQNRRMGVQLQEMDPDLADYFMVKEGEGVLVTHVDAESAAEQAGLKSGDVLMAVNDQAVHKIEEVTKAVQESDSDTLQIAYVRKGRRDSTTVVLSERKPLNLQLRFNGDSWPFSGETMEELRKDLEELRDELNDLKIHMNIDVEKK
ncbi:MAG TPA: PDZ domain-containing protein [bacterium]|nr:PDZ domain-containing protein [bacterium]HQI47497.1 PDZ domain-containing protein [bacterium]HQJ65763.1 PDZ domain-containing protein [bacterium]